MRFVPVSRTPTSSTHAKKECGGVQIMADDWATFEPVHTGIAIAVELHWLFPTEWKTDRYNRLLANLATFEGLKAGNRRTNWDVLGRRLGGVQSAAAEVPVVRLTSRDPSLRGERFY